MSPIAAVSAVRDVEARVAEIRTRFGASDPGLGALSVIDPTLMEPDTTGFDPFGATYQAALDAFRQAPLPAAGTPSVQFQAYGLDSVQGGGAVRVAPPASYGSIGGASATGGGSGASIGRIGGYGQMPVPPELAAYGNGRIPSNALVPIGQGGHRLYGPAAEAWKSAVDAAAAEGVSLRVTDSYRSYDQQVDLAARKGIYSEGGWAATPGTSNHGWGMAVDADVSDPATLTWIRANGWRFGFVEAVPREPWHWEYRPNQA
jgi:zinc D-Ala-D-Ala carboxypeptidase